MAEVLAFPKPKDMKLPKRGHQGVVTFPDGREVCKTKQAWAKRRRERWELDGGRCQMFIAPGVRHNIRLSLQEAHIHHKKRRGMGGGKRDDRIENLLTACEACHAQEHS